MEPQLAIDRYAELKERGLDTFGIVRQLRQEYALSVGQAKEIIIRHETGQSLTSYQGTLLEPLIRAFKETDLPEPEFEIDDAVETTGEHTSRRGLIRERIWHYNDEKWHYYLVVDGKKVSKRYCSSDLRRTNNSEQGGAGQLATRSEPK